jgi:hypothetical protein
MVAQVVVSSIFRDFSPECFRDRNDVQRALFFSTTSGSTLIEGLKQKPEAAQQYAAQVLRSRIKCGTGCNEDQSKFHCR